MKKPKIKLNALENIAVHTPTQEDYDTLMQVFECGGWKWKSGSNLIMSDNWETYRENTCIGAGVNSINNKKGRFSYDSINYYEKKGFGIISPRAFYILEKISNEKLGGVKKYFNRK